MQTSPLPKRRIFWGWYIIGLMIVSMALVFGIRTSFSIFFEPVLKTFPTWYRGSTALMLSLNIFIYGLAAPLAGLMVDRWKPRATAVIGLLLLALTTAGCYYAHSLWYFYLMFGGIGPVGAAFCASPVLNASVINWFGKSRGLGVGLGQIGGGFSFVYGLMVQAVIDKWGWQVCFLVMGGLILVVLLPLYLVFYYHRPEDKGFLPYDALKPKNYKNVVDVPKPAKEWNLRAAYKTYQLWLLVFTEFCFWGIGNYLVLAHQVKFAEDVGFSSLLSTSVFALYGFVSIFGQIASAVSDKWGREKTLTIASVLAVGGLVALMSVNNTSQVRLLYVYAISSGFATGVFSPVIIVGLADIFYGKNISSLSGLLMTGMGFGGVIGPWLGGYLYDKLGSYHVAFLVSLIAFIVGTVAFWLAAPRNAEKLRTSRLG
ncbi:MAG TPA: MFS transporter [Dehalococcoidales bacterium]|nr:MFS transporter [Dehalococcoidales bacterium]